MDRDTLLGSGSDELDMAAVHTGLAILVEVCERAVEQLGGTVPGAQLRAPLIVDRHGRLNIRRLAARLGASESATAGCVTGWRRPAW